MQDHHLLEKLAHFNRERIPERVVHAKAVGAHGTLTVTKDITKYTKAKLFSEVGKKTEVFGRISTDADTKHCGHSWQSPQGYPEENGSTLPQSRSGLWRRLCTGFRTGLTAGR